VTTIVIIPTIPGVASNNVTVTSDVDDPNPEDNSDEENTDVNLAPGPTPSAPPSGPTASPFPPPGGPGGVTAIPTLSGWAMMLLPMLLMIAAVYILKRQERERRSRGM
jgi:hypothetical protein